jgi:alpha-L-fucosidase
MKSHICILIIYFLIIIFIGCAKIPSNDPLKRPDIKKLGTIDCDLVETSPIVFNGKLYRFEYVRERYEQNTTGNAYFRFIDHESGKATPAFAHGYHLGSAFVEEDTIYVTAVDIWDGERIEMFASSDLLNWSSWTVLNLPGYGLFNTSLCKAEDRYVLMYEVGKPPEVAGKRFTARFAVSDDLKRWQATAPECTYAKDRYTAPHCLRYLNGYFYNFYLEAFEGYETRVVRSKDLINWEPSPVNPVLKASADDRKIANPSLTPEQQKKIAEAKNINNSDIDFCEFNGRVIINYSWGNQRGTEFLAEAVYEGTIEEFIKGWYDN